VRVILCESPDRFARDLVVQLTGHSFLKTMGVTLIPTTSPSYFTEETPTAVLIRSVLGAVAQFEKASLVAKMKAARDRKIAAGEKCGGRKSHLELQPDVVGLARQAAPAGRVAARHLGQACPSAVISVDPASRSTRARSATCWNPPSRSKALFKCYHLTHEPRRGSHREPDR